MKKWIKIIIIAAVLLSFFSCATLNEMKGTYISFTPLVDRAFDPDHYAAVGFAYTPESAEGMLFKKEFSAYLRGRYFKVIDEKSESDAIRKTGLSYKGFVKIEDARKLGKVMNSDAMIIVKKANFTANGKAEYISLDIADTYGGVLIRAVYRGGDNPPDIESAVKSIVNGIDVENMKLEMKHEGRDDRMLIP